MGRTWAKNLAESGDAELAAWVDIREGAAAQAAEELALSPEYTGQDIEAAARAVSAEFVVDVTVPEAHKQVTLQALSMGLPVIGEKPMAPSMAEAKEMVRASEQAGKLYMVSQSRRYNASIGGYRKLISQIGELGILNADFFIGAHFGGFRDEMTSPLILDMAIHTFDQARYLSGADPVSVLAEEFNPPWSWYEGDACANAIFEMAGGLRFAYRGSWCSEGLHTSWEGSWRAVGSKGSATWDGADGIRAQVVRQTGGFHSEFDEVAGSPLPVKEGIAGSLEEFLQALRSGSTPQGECHDNIKSLAMVFAVVESSRTSGRVTIEEMMA